MAELTKTAPPRRRLRWLWRSIIIVAVLGLLAGGTELALRAIIPGVIEGAVRDQLKLTDDHPVDVELGGSTLLNALRGGVGDVSITSPDVPLLEGIAADAAARADFVPFDPRKGTVSNATLALTVTKEQLSPVVKVLTQGIADSGEVRGDELVVGRTVSVFGQDVSITASLRLGVSDGAVTVDPTGVRAAGFDMSAKQISKATGSFLDPILQEQTVCIADRLPRGVTLTGIDLSSTGSATLRADLAPGIISDAKQQETGSCA